MYKPIRVHIKYSLYPKIEKDTDALVNEIKRNFDDKEVFVSKERSALLLNNYEVWVVGGKLLHSRRNGEGIVNNDEKRNKIVQGIKEALDCVEANDGKAWFDQWTSAPETTLKKPSGPISATAPPPPAPEAPPPAPPEVPPEEAPPEEAPPEEAPPEEGAAEG
jgi:hypothetical protein